MSGPDDGGFVVVPGSVINRVTPCRIRCESATSARRSATSHCAAGLRALLLGGGPSVMAAYRWQADSPRRTALFTYGHDGRRPFCMAPKQRVSSWRAGERILSSLRPTEYCLERIVHQHQVSSPTRIYFAAVRTASLQSSQSPRALGARLWRRGGRPELKSVALPHIGRRRWSRSFDITAVEGPGHAPTFCSIVKNHLSNLRGIAVVRRCRVEHAPVPQDHIAGVAKELKGFNVGQCLLEAWRLGAARRRRRRWSGWGGCRIE